MTFSEAMAKVALGLKVRRSAWEDPRVLVLFANGYLSIQHADGRESALLVSFGDMFSDDWAIVGEGEYTETASLPMMQTGTSPQTGGSRRTA